MPVYKNPPWRLVATPLLSLSETVDWSVKQYDLPDVWQRTKGEGVKVAVLDTGCQVDHPDLSAAIDEARDFTDSPWGPEDSQGHGTWCAGMIGARADGGGLIGVAPLCRLAIGKVLGDDGSGLDAQIAAGIRWAIEQGAQLISMSLGGPLPNLEIAQAIFDAQQAGVMVIAAAGNDGPRAGGRSTVNYPARLPPCLAVGAVDRQGKVADFSSRGPEVDIAAPGVDMLSCFPRSRYARLSGTSMATPFVAGIAALALAKHIAHGGETPIEMVADLRDHLLRHARDAGAPGPDNDYGAGIVAPATVLGDDPGPPPALLPGDRIVGRIAGPGILIYRPG